MTSPETTESQHLIAALTGRYVLGTEAQRPGVNLFACRLKTISATGYFASAPVVGNVGDSVTASFEPFGTLRGTITRLTPDGFAVDIKCPPAERAKLRDAIDMFRHRLWTGEADKRGEPRFMPGEPRSVIALPTGERIPCLIVDFSASGAAVSAEVTPAAGTRVTIGQIVGTVVRGFELGFAVQFEALQDREEVEHFLRAPEQWLQAASAIKLVRIDTSEGEDLALAGASY